jgi:hypothetical protein
MSTNGLEFRGMSSFYLIEDVVIDWKLNDKMNRSKGTLKPSVSTQ